MTFDTNGDTIGDTNGDTVDDTNVTNFSLSIHQLTCHLLIIGANVLQHPNILKAKDVDGLRLVVLRRVNEMYAMPVVWKRLVKIWEKQRRQAWFFYLKTIQVN